MNKSHVSVILPAYNEGQTIGRMIAEVNQLAGQYQLEIIVADGGSTDDTAALARSSGAKVLEFPHKRGKGIDFWEAAKTAQGDFVVQIDADGQFSPKEIPLLVRPLEEGAEVAIARRMDHRRAPWVRTLGNKIFVTFTTIIAQAKVYDVVAGFKAFRTPVLLSLDLLDAHFGYEGEIVVKALRMGYKLVQVPVSYHPRAAGKSQVIPLRDGARTIFSILKARFGKLPPKAPARH
jgi:glycosyltransferase involved in cell wall biosynthesis